MKWFSPCVLLVVSFYTSLAIASSDGCELLPDSVVVYKHDSYKGSCNRLGIGSYVDSDQMRMDNDSVTSIEVGSDVQLLACKDSWRGDTGFKWRGSVIGPKDSHTYEGRKKIFHDMLSRNTCQIFTASISHLKRSRIGNDSISSVVVIERQPPVARKTDAPCFPGPDRVAIYQAREFAGNCRILDVGSYENSKRMNFKNDSISSIQVGENVGARVCQNSNFGGRCETIREDVPSLKHSNVGENKITSIRIKRVRR
jgi:hypothetical protein